ncbi:hypothetical protein AOQ84DRAFT_225138 [Glonium stellatum]|uniref:Nitrate reductase [NADPH] n=1 Tax=Glonium stellatum TaxID=574774 RepID=A0A8E2JZY2_9PEZI|nr:hypothetical protein AOQ84DRAFT_225138 [Glonium stellatum]
MGIMPPVMWKVRVKDHPGSSLEEIQSEPDWAIGHEHRIGYKNRQDRFPGLTHADDEIEEAKEQSKEAKKEHEELEERTRKGELVNFRDIIKNQKDLSLRIPENRSIGWRYVLDCSEDWVKNQQPWPANNERKKKEEAKEDGKKQRQVQESSDDQESKPQQENEWKRDQGEGSKHHDAYGNGSDSGYSSDSNNYKTEYEKLIKNLKQNDGQQECPAIQNRTHISIDEADQFTPDNWLPRSSDLIRSTGKHPMNAEAPLSDLFSAGLITPNELHYVRNHGAAPRLIYEFHEIDVNGKMNLSMNDLKKEFKSINIAIALACDGNRRKELNLIKRSKGFNWGPGAVSCAYWRGPLLRDVLLAAGVLEELSKNQSQRRWVNFQGADEPSEGKYATSIPFEYAMDWTNDVILAYEMNGAPLPPDHGYPVRLMVPGYVGGRCVKWLKKIWVSDKENDSYYHIWDNRVLPSFITEKDGEFAEALFHHPDTACYEQNLNSVIAKPAQGERISLTEVRKGHTYRIQGYAYDGGHEVQQVEVSLDDGESWLYCVRKFPDAPIRHGNQYWSWLHWHVDVEIIHLLQAKSITVRCFNVFKNTQPKEPTWNLTGMMNNCWYVIRPEIVQGSSSDIPSILFRHPAEPASGQGGWMKPSVENQIAHAKQEAGAPQKQFTRQEIEKHDKEDDCWIVVNGKVYDATSVLSWHPGGKSAILGHAGKVHQTITEEFSGVHDGFAYQKLKECVLGIVTDKTMNFIKKNAEAAAKGEGQSEEGPDSITLQKHRWVPVKLVDRKPISGDTRTYTFSLPHDKVDLGLGTCQHIQLGFHLKDRMLIRSYTPTRPLLPSAELDSKSGAKGKVNHQPNNDTETNPALHDGTGTFNLTVKTYFPSSAQPGGAMSNILDCMPIGEEIEIRGPTGEIVYNGSGNFIIEDKNHHFARISLVLGGSGITPGYALIARILLSKGDETEIRVVDANKSETDILLKEDLDKFEMDSKGQLKVRHVLSHPNDGWKGLKGHVGEDVIKKNLFEPKESSVVLLCGPPAMIQKAALPALKDWGYIEDQNMFGF